MKNTFTSIDVTSMIAITVIIAVVVALFNPSDNSKQRSGQKQSPTVDFWVGDTVYIDGLNITGRVNHIRRELGPDRFDILILGTNGVPVMIEQVNERLIKKVTLK